MKILAWPSSESGRLAIAALLAVAMHLSLAALPVHWRPALQQPTVLRVTLTAPPPVPTPAPEPVMPVAAVAPVAAPPAESIPSATPEPPVPPTAARPLAAPKTAKAPPPKRQVKRESPKPPVVAQPKPAPKPKPLKPTAPPPVVTAKTTSKDRKTSEQSERPRRLASAQPAMADSDGTEDWDSATPRRDDRRTYRRASDADFGGSSARGQPAQSMTPSSGGESGGGSGAAGPTIARSAPVETRLRPLPDNPQPRYPAEARQRGIEGRVILRLTVNAAGSVEAASVARSSGNDLLDQEARRTVLRWRFQPLAGPRVAQVPITFRLSN